MSEAQDKARKEKTFKAVMIGLMVGSGTYLAERYLLKIDVDTAVVVATGVAVALTVYLLQQIARS